MSTILPNYKKIFKDRYFDTLQTGVTNKVPRYTDIATLGFPFGEPGMEGNVVLDRVSSTFYGHNGTMWVPMGGASAVEPLDETLAAGNETNGNNIVISGNDEIIGTRGTLSLSQTPVELRSTNQLVGLRISTVDGTGLVTTPDIDIETGDQNAAGFLGSGNINVRTGDAPVSTGNGSGDIIVETGSTPRQSGDITLATGDAGSITVGNINLNSGVPTGVRAGRVVLGGGGSTSAPRALEFNYPSTSLMASYTTVDANNPPNSATINYTGGGVGADNVTIDSAPFGTVTIDFSGTNLAAGASSGVMRIINSYAESCRMYLSLEVPNSDAGGQKCIVISVPNGSAQAIDIVITNLSPATAVDNNLFFVHFLCVSRSLPI